VHFEEGQLLYRIYTPVVLLPTAEARKAIGVELRQAGHAAWREIAMAARGLEIAHHQFAFRELTLALCSRIRRDGLVEIELGLGNPRLPASSFTAKQLREAEAAALARTRPHRGAVRPRPH
jgi:hypothetical protein